jgi:hypothetical protein
MIEVDHVIQMSEDGGPSEKTELADAVAREGAWAAGQFDIALESAAVRRWARGYLLTRLSSDQAQHLAARLLEWKEDFEPERRDRSTTEVVNTLSESDLWRNLANLASSNAAGAFWERISRSGRSNLMQAANEVLKRGDVRARETTLHLLVLDPYGPELIDRSDQNRLLLIAMDDPDDEIRGLAAEVVAADLPDLLINRRRSAELDPSERVRMAYWRAAFTYEPEQSAGRAAELVLDSDVDDVARRTALIAFGEHGKSVDVSPLLQALVMHDDRVLAEDAAQLMWRYHRVPAVAMAAAESPHETVRNLAQRLLNPESGSPAAGGSRPGDQTKAMNVFDQIYFPGDPER